MTHTSPCKTLTECIQEKNDTMEIISDRLISIENDLNDLHKMKDDLSTIAEILSAWNNAKGFVTTVKILGKVAIFIVAIGAAYAAIIHGLGFGK